MKNIKVFHGISTAFHIISVICTVILIIGLLFVTAASVFFLALPDDTMEITAQGTVGAYINAANVISDPFGFIDNMEEKKTLDKGDGGEVSYEVKNGKISGYVKGYEKYNQGTATFNIKSDGTFFGEAKSQKYKINNYQIGIVMIPMILSLMFLLVASFYGRRIFKELRRCVTPFTDTVRKNLLKISAVILGYSFIPAVLGTIFLSCMGLSNIENSGISLSYTDVSITTIVVAVVLFVLSLVFSYGVNLQQQADETL